MNLNFSKSLTKLKKSKLFIGLLPVFVILAVTFITTVNTFSPGMYKTHDGNIHIVRSLHFKNELIRGQFPVRMVADLAYTYGYPVFNFFYPLPYYATAIFQAFDFSTVDSWKMMQVAVTFLSLWVFYKWLRSSFDLTSALMGTVLYGIVPFRLLTLYVTGQVGGFFSLLFAPMVALGLYKMLQTKEQILGGILLALGIAGLITSHIISSIIFFLPLFVYGMVLLFKNFSKVKFIQLAGWSLLGLGLSAFYILPFLIEKEWIKLGHQILVDHRQHWPSFRQLLYSPWGYGYSNPGENDGMSYQVGLAVLVTFFLSFILIIRQKKSELMAMTMLGLFVILFYLMLPDSSPIWEVVKPLQFLQYPWRILAGLSFVASWLLAWSLSQVKGLDKLLLALTILGLAFYNVRNYMRPWPIDSMMDSDYINDGYEYNSSTDISWELLPINVRDVPNVHPPATLNDVTSSVIVLDSERPKQGKVTQRLTVQVIQPDMVNLAVWDLPVWQVRVDGELVNKQVAPDGTILVPVEPGQTLVELEMVETKVELLANLITLLSLITVIGFLASIILKSGAHNRFNFFKRDHQT